jgi:hypothetical protein
VLDTAARDRAGELAARRDGELRADRAGSRAARGDDGGERNAVPPPAPAPDVGENLVQGLILAEIGLANLLVLA